MRTIENNNDSLKCGGKRPKKFLGAAIGLIGGLAGGIMQNIAANKQRHLEEELAKKKKEQEENASLTQHYANDATSQSDLNQRLAAEYKSGGKVNAKGIVIKKGGTATPLSNDTLLLRGNSHSQGGIDIDTGKAKIEAENGEVLKLGGNSMKIYSAKPILSGQSPAKAVMNNPSNADLIFKAQEAYKDRNNLKDDGTKKGDSNKKALGDYLGIKRQYESEDDMQKALLAQQQGKTTGNVATSITSLAAPIASGIMGLIATNKMKAPEKPQLYQAADLQTNYNISPQLSSIERAAQNAQTDVSNNTASSVASLARRQRIGLNATEQSNLLRGQKENIETELINKDKLNKQQVAAQNTSVLNNYADRSTAFANKKLEGQANATNAMISAVSDFAKDWQSRSDKKEREQQGLAAIMAGDVNNSTMRAIEMGAITDQATLLKAYQTTNDESARRMIATKLGIPYTIKKQAKNTSLTTQGITNNNSILPNKL